MNNLILVSTREKQRVCKSELSKTTGFLPLAERSSTKLEAPLTHYKPGHVNKSIQSQHISEEIVISN